MHDHEWVDAHSCCHVECDYAVSDVSSVGFGNDGACCVHVGHALHDFELFESLSDGCHGELCGLFGLQDLQFGGFVFFHDGVWLMD